MKLLPVFSALLGAVLLLCTQPATAQLYEVRSGTLGTLSNGPATLQMQADGSAQWLRDFWQSWLKDRYNIKLKGDGTLGVGKKTVMEARQIPVSSISSKLLDLYSTVSAPTDSTAELTVYAAFDKTAYLSESATPSEYAALRNLVESFATAAHMGAYRAQVEEAEKQLHDTEKEKDKLEKDVKNLRGNTASNLARIAALQKQNEANATQAQQDSVKLLTNTQQLELRKVQVQRRRARLLGLGK